MIMTSRFGMTWTCKLTNIFSGLSTEQVNHASHRPKFIRSPMSSRARKKNKNRFQLYSSSSDPQPTNVDHVPTLSNFRRSARRYNTIISTSAATIDSTLCDDSFPNVEMSYVQQASAFGAASD